MFKLVPIRMLAVVFIALAAFAATPASAQATRTWVSGVGDDVNPCSRTAPCKTFAGAISKTAAGGEINCLDPGGFGAVTITKSMTINCLYTEGGVLAGGNGIVVNDSLSGTPGTAVVYLKGLDIFGVNPPTHGVRFVSGASLVIEDSVIRRFNASTSTGVSFAPSTASTLILRNVTIANNGGGAATAGGVDVRPTGAGSAGVFIQDSLINNNNGFGISATGTAGVRVGNTTIINNITGVVTSGGAQVLSYADNRLDGNGAGETFTSTIVKK
jgi:hypothetical protein